MPSPRRRVVPAALALAAAAATAAAAGEPSWRIAPIPSWVEPVAIPPPRTAATPGPRGLTLLLDDSQVRVSEAGVATFTRRVEQVDGATGLHNLDEIEIQFDPAFERLLLHYLRVGPPGRQRDLLPGSEISLLRAEQDRDARLYDGTLTAVIFLREVRVGDTIDVAYTLEGNPALGQHVATAFEMALEQPVRRLSRRLLWPAGRHLNLRSHGGAPEPAVARRADTLDYRWDLADVPATTQPEGAPVDWSPLPWVQVSDFESWARVVSWSLPFYHPPVRDVAPLDALAASIAARARTPAERLVAAARFVQDEIRYLGIEIGPSSYVPHPPDQVLAQRFGDCKDKTLLLVHLLDRLGIVAWPALVATDLGTTIDRWAPSPYAFDHVVVETEIDGRRLWIDTTLTHQGGGVEGFARPPAPRALVLAPGTAALARLEQPPLAEPGSELREDIDASAWDRPARLTALSTYRGSDADDLRALLTEQSIEEIGRDSLDALLLTDPQAQTLGPPRVEDDRERNQIRIREEFLLPGFWHRRRGQVSLWALEHELPEARSAVGAAPMAVAYPVFLVHAIHLRAPAPLDLRSGTETVTDGAFELRVETRLEGATATVRGSYRALADRVEPERVVAYLAHVRAARELVSIGLAEHADGPASRPAGGSLATFLAAAALLVAVAALGLATHTAARARRRG